MGFSEYEIFTIYAESFKLLIVLIVEYSRSPVDIFDCGMPHT